jgi:hypothetical protein
LLSFAFFIISSVSFWQKRIRLSMLLPNGYCRSDSSDAYWREPCGTAKGCSGRLAMRTLLCSVVLFAVSRGTPIEASQAGTEAALWLEQLVQANITAVHAYLVLLARKVPRADATR